LIKGADALFINAFDSQNHLNPIVVKSRGATRMEIIINYLAARAFYLFTKKKIQ